MNIRGSAWRWAVVGGLFVAVIDVAARMFAAAGYPDEIGGYIEILDFWASLLAYYAVGVLAARSTGRAKSGAEMGVVAGAIAGLVNLVMVQAVPVPSELPLVSQLVVALSQNVFLGGATGVLAGWFTVRQNTPPPGTKR